MGSNDCLRLPGESLYRNLASFREFAIFSFSDTGNAAQDKFGFVSGIGKFGFS